MPKKMLINALHAEEARVAIVEDGRLMDLGIEIAGREQTRGNVYKGVVVRVEPGLQAAFIDIGLKKLGFLQMGELHPEFWQWRDDVPPENRNRRPRIQEVLRRGQELLVQVEKGERDMKGAAVTSYLSLPGRYMVLLPGSDSAGVSRKVEAEGERKKLKEMAAELNIPEGIGFIIRTEALGKKQAELSKDFQYLLKLNESIREAAARVKGPALIYQESDLIIRTIRDYFTSEIDEVLVDSTEVFEQAKTFFKEVMPRMVGRVKLHQEKRPIFSRYQLEEQIDSIYEKKVLLKSGGSLVIEPAEALVSIDVNSGKSTGERGVEDTAYKTNMEAAEEAARQLRLRDLGGLIVIDFIDMRDRKHNADVEKALKHALKSDKARVTVGKISQFGLLEMSRQRIRQTANEAVYLECPHCEGRGRIKSVEAMAVSFLRKVHASAAKGTIGEVRGGLPLEVAYYLLNRKKKDLARIEADYDIEVTIKGKPSFLMNQIELELLKREKPSSDGQAEVSQTPLVTAPVFPPEEEISDEVESEEEVEVSGTSEELSAMEEETGEAGKKRKRRRGKKKPLENDTATVDAGENAVEVEDEAEPVGEDAGDDGDVDLAGEDAGDDGDVEPVTGEPAVESAVINAAKKRKRRRKRGKSSLGTSLEAALPVVSETGQVETSVEEHDAGEVADVESVATDAAEGSGTVEEAKKKRRRRRRGGAKRRVEGSEGAVEDGVVPDDALHVETQVEETAEVVEDNPLPLPEIVEAPVLQVVSRETSVPVAKKPRVARPPRRVKATPDTQSSDEVSPEVPQEENADALDTSAEVPVKRPRRATRKTRPFEPAGIIEGALVEVPVVVEVVAAPPKAKRSARKSVSAQEEAGDEHAVLPRKRLGRKKKSDIVDDDSGNE